MHSDCALPGATVQESGSSIQASSDDLLMRSVARGDKRAMEVIWGNRLKAGDFKYIGSFPHFVADGGDDRVGRWLDERIDLEHVYAEIWKDAMPAHVVDVAVFCDSDDTHTASISYFAYVRLERR